MIHELTKPDFEKLASLFETNGAYEHLYAAMKMGWKEISETETYIEFDGLRDTPQWEKMFKHAQK